MSTFYDQGTYNATIQNAVINPKNKNDNPEMVLTILPTEKLTQDSVEPNQFDYTRNIFLTFTDATMGTPEAPGWVALTLQALGFTGKSFEELAAHNFVGQTIRVRCKHDEYQGKAREVWEIVRSRDKTVYPQADNKQLKALGAKFNNVLKAMSTSTPTNGTRNTKKEEKTDDIPF